MKQKPLSKKKEIQANKNGLSLFVKGLGKRVKQIGQAVEYTQCVGMKILYLVFTILDVRLFTYKADFINTAILFLAIYM